MIMNRIPCELIRDLFPSYIDDLTSDTSNGIIEEHISECADCNNILEKMKKDYEEPHIVADYEQKEINFLKKNKKKNRRIIIGSLAAAVMVVFVIIALRFYVIGDYVSGSQVKAAVNVDWHMITVDGILDDDTRTVSDVVFEEKDGIVTIRIKAVRSNPVSSHDAAFSAEYTASTDISDIYLNDLIVWSDGENIPEYTSKIYNTVHSYMGDMPANNNTANTIDIAKLLGEYDNRLITDKQPYGWVIRLKDTLPDKNNVDRMIKEKNMESIAYVLLAVTGNLDEVIYEYNTADAGDVTVTYTIEKANEYFAGDVRECSYNIKLLNSLLKKTGLV